MASSALFRDLEIHQLPDPLAWRSAGLPEGEDVLDLCEAKPQGPSFVNEDQAPFLLSASRWPEEVRREG